MKNESSMSWVSAWPKVAKSILLLSNSSFQQGCASKYVQNIDYWTSGNGTIAALCSSLNSLRKRGKSEAEVPKTERQGHSLPKASNATSIFCVRLFFVALSIILAKQPFARR